jgi:hypothetical protein
MDREASRGQLKAMGGLVLIIMAALSCLLGMRRLHLELCPQSPDRCIRIEYPESQPGRRE